MQTCTCTHVEYAPATKFKCECFQRIDLFPQPERSWHIVAGMILVGLSATIAPDGPWLRAAGILLLAGIVLFSGSLYALALSAPRGLGMVTPLGGLAFLLGWLALALALLRA